MPFEFLDLKKTSAVLINMVYIHVCVLYAYIYISIVGYIKKKKKVILYTTTNDYN